MSQPGQDVTDRAVDAVTGSLDGTRKPYAADRTLELPMTLISRTVKRTAQAINAMQPGQVLEVYTDDP